MCLSLPVGIMTDISPAMFPISFNSTAFTLLKVGLGRCLKEAQMQTWKLDLASPGIKIHAKMLQDWRETKGRYSI